METRLHVLGVIILHHTQLVPTATAGLQHREVTPGVKSEQSLPNYVIVCNTPDVKL